MQPSSKDLGTAADRASSDRISILLRPGMKAAGLKRACRFLSCITDAGNRELALLSGLATSFLAGMRRADCRGLLILKEQTFTPVFTISHWKENTDQNTCNARLWNIRNGSLLYLQVIP